MASSLFSFFTHNNNIVTIQHLFFKLEYPCDLGEYETKRGYRYIYLYHRYLFISDVYLHRDR